MKASSKTMCVLAAVCLLSARSAESFEWWSSKGKSEAQCGGPRITPDIKEVKTPRPTAKVGVYSKEYTIELEKFNINNRNSNPVETSKGINAALQFAKEQGFNQIIFPRGSYLISETEPIVISHKDTIINLNKAILTLNTSGSDRCSMIKIQHGSENLRLTNGTLRGDRESHDYKTKKGWHDRNQLLTICSGNGIEVDHLRIQDAAGTGVGTEYNGYLDHKERRTRYIATIYAKDLEKGGFSKKGEKREAELVRTIEMIDLSKAVDGKFEVGNVPGGFRYIKNRVYQMYFFAEDKSFLDRRRAPQYRKISVPDKAKFMHLEFNQPEVLSPTNPKHSIIRVTNCKPPTNVHFHHNYITNTRVYGLSLDGGQRWVIEKNRFVKNGDEEVRHSAAFKLRGGYESMFDIVVRRNEFKESLKYDLVVDAGTELLFEDNDFTKSVSFNSRTHNYHVKKNNFKGGTVSYNTSTGVAKIRGNRYKGTELRVYYNKRVGDYDGFYRTKGQRIATPALTLKGETIIDAKRINGTYLNIVDSTLKNVTLEVARDTKSLKLLRSGLESTTIRYHRNGPKLRVNIAGCHGEVKEKGAIKERKKE